MRWRIATIGKTAVHVHAALPLVVMMAFLSGRGLEVMTALAGAALHEGAHALAAGLMGSMPTEVELTPLGAVMRLEDEQTMPDGRRMLMLLAGPAMTLLLCLLSLQGAVDGWMRWHTARRIFMANAGILVINLIPALPLDGGRMLALILGRMMKAATVRRVMRSLGLLLGLGAVTVNAWAALFRGVSNVSLAAAGCFLISGTFASAGTRAMEQLRSLVDKKIRLERQGRMGCEVIMVLGDEPLVRHMEENRTHRATLAVVMERGTMNLLGYVTEFEAVSWWLSHPGSSWMECLKKEKVR